MPDEYARRDLLSNHWHQDSFAADTVKVYLALHDITLAHGPFQFLSRADSRLALRAARSPRIDADVPSGVEPQSVHRFTGTKGAMLLVNTIHCLHKAGVPAPGVHRDLVEMRFTATRHRPHVRQFR